MNLLYDLITILPYSLLLLLFCGGYAGIPEDGILPYVLTLLLPAGLTVLRHMKPRNGSVSCRSAPCCRGGKPPAAH